MFGARFRRSVCSVIAIVAHRAGLIAVVLTGDGEDRQRNFLKLLGVGHHRVVIGVHRRMFQDALKTFGWIADERIERAERDVLFVGIQKFRPPEF